MKGRDHRCPIFLDYPSFLRVCDVCMHLYKCQLYLKIEGIVGSWLTWSLNAIKSLYHKNKMSLISAKSFVKHLSQIWLFKGDLKSLR